MQLPRGVARIEVDNEDFLVTGPAQADVDMIANPLQAWDIAFQKLTYDIPSPQPCHSPEPRQHLFIPSAQRRLPPLPQQQPLPSQHQPRFSMWVSASPNSHAVEFSWLSPKPSPNYWPITLSRGVTRYPEKAPADKAAFQSAFGILRFFTETTHPAISCITGMLGRHLL